MEQKEKLQKGPCNTPLHNLCISASFIAQDRARMTSHIKLLLEDLFHHTPDTSQMVNFGLFILSVSITVAFSVIKHGILKSERETKIRLYYFQNRLIKYSITVQDTCTTYCI